MEEFIKDIKERLKRSNKFILYFNVEDIERLIRIIDMLESENVHKSKYIKELENKICQMMCKQYKYTSENYISVQKIKDKINELENRKRELVIENSFVLDYILKKDKYYTNYDTQDIRIYCIYNEFKGELRVLEELLKSEE